MANTKSFIKIASGLVTALSAGYLIMACAQTAAPAPNIIARAQGESAPVPAATGCLGSDYALLQPAGAGSDQKAQLAYINPSANFSSYSKLIIVPVTFWGDNDTKLSAEDQQNLCDYFTNKLKETLGKNFTLVNEPGPGVAKLSVALTDASSAVPGLRTIAVIVPQAHVLALLKQGATGTYSFVGSATGELKLTDSVSGQLLAAASDKRFGSGAVTNAAVWQWGDAEHAMDYWANTIDQKLVTLGVQHTSTKQAAD